MGTELGGRERRIQRRGQADASPATLRIGRVDDPAEARADSFADLVEDVMHSSWPSDASDGPSRIRRTTARRGAATSVPIGSNRVRRAAVAPHDPLGGTTVDAVTARRITSVSGGVGVPDEVRRSAEEASGLDLGGVRIHQGAESAALSSSLQATAFTVGTDIFLGSDAAQPGTAAGDRLLAHELGHVVDEGGGAAIGRVREPGRATAEDVQSGGVRRSTIRRMTVAQPNFPGTTGVEIQTAGASGRVAKFTDGDGTIVVKVDQVNGNEVAVADKLMGAATQGRMADRHGGYGATSPTSRTATPQEVAQIRVAARAHIGNQDPRNFMTGLDSPNPVILAEALRGRRFAELTDPDATSASSLAVVDDDGRKSVNPNSVAMELLKSRSVLQVLAKGSVADLVMGMYDRLHGVWNPENFLYDTDSRDFGFVDNTQIIKRGFLITRTDGGELLSSFDAYQAWCGEERTGQLRDKRYAALAEGMFATVWKGVQARFRGNRARDQIEAAFDEHEATLVAAIADGIKAGHAPVLRQLKNTVELTSGVQAEKRQEAMQALGARYYFLKGGRSDMEAWTKATTEATHNAKKLARG